MRRFIQKLKERIERMVIMMAMLFACRVADGRTESFSLVPARLKAQVARIIITDFGLPELVPQEFGGCAA